MTPREKAQKFLDSFDWKKPVSFTYEGVEITLTDAQLYKDTFQVWVTADVYTDNPYQFMNPPVSDDLVVMSEILQRMVGRAVMTVARRIVPVGAAAEAEAATEVVA